LATVLTAVHGQCLVITLNRPESANAITAQLVDELLAATALLEERDDLSVGVLTGAGAHFCAGMDLKAFRTEGKPAHLETFLRGRTSKPLVAAIEGAAVGGGLEIALTCDLIVAGDGAKLGIPEVKVGLLAAGGGVVRLAQALPRQTALQLALTGEPITASRAYDLGLVSRLAPRGQALDEALLVADQIARNAPLAVAHSRELVAAAREKTAEALWEEQSVRLSAVLGSADAVEGPAAFAEGRPPAWTGR
jgi:enoyl-CoA hydratase